MAENVEGLVFLNANLNDLWHYLELKKVFIEYYWVVRQQLFVFYSYSTE